MKQIEINTGRWTGHVVLHDPIPLIKLATFEDSVTEALKIDKNLGKAKSHVALLPALLECVSEWHINDIPEKPNLETFPGAGSGISKVDVAILVNLIVNRLMKLYQGDDPNA